MKSLYRQRLKKFLDPLVARWKLILACLLIAAAAGLVVYQQSPRVYRSTSLLSYEYRQGESDGVSREKERQHLEERVSAVAALVTSRITLERLVAQFDLYPDSRYQLSPEGRVELMRKHIRITPGRFAVSVSFTGDRPDTVMGVANALAVQFIEKNYVYLESGRAPAVPGQEKQGYVFTVAEPARFPGRPYRPVFAVIMMAAAGAGLLIGSSLAYAVHWLDPSLKDAADVEQYLDLPVVCSISHLAGDDGNAGNRSPVFQHGARDKRLARAAADGWVCESFCTLRTRILHPMHGTPPKSLLVVSADSGAGKSFVCANMGISFARGIDNHAILVDADLKAPSLAQLFGFPNDQGLVDFLRDDADLAGLVTAVGHEKLQLIPAGLPPMTAEELLGAESMAGLVTELRQCFAHHILIFDAPPLDSAAEVAQLAQHVDAVLLVVRWGSSRKRQVKSVVDHIGRDKIAGVVLNGYRQTVLESKLFAGSR